MVYLAQCFRNLALGEPARALSPTIWSMAMAFWSPARARSTSWAAPSDWVRLAMSLFLHNLGDFGGVHDESSATWTKHARCKIVNLKCLGLCKTEVSLEIELGKGFRRHRFRNAHSLPSDLVLSLVRHGLSRPVFPQFGLGRASAGVVAYHLEHGHGVLVSGASALYEVSGAVCLGQLRCAHFASITSISMFQPSRSASSRLRFASVCAASFDSGGER